MDTAPTPLCILPSWKLSEKKWYEEHYQVVDEAYDRLISTLTMISLPPGYSLGVYDDDALYWALVRHMYTTSYNSDKGFH